MGELINFTYNNHKKILYKGLWNCLQDRYATDFIITDSSGGGSSKIHLLILSIFCPLLRESKNKSLNLDVNGDDIGSIIEYIYRGKVSMKEERLAGVKHGAEILGLNCLVEQIDKYNCLKQTSIKNRVRSVNKRSKSCNSADNEPEMGMSQTQKVKVDANRETEGEAAKFCEVAVVEECHVTDREDVKGCEFSSEEVSDEKEDEEYVLPGKQKCNVRRTRRSRRPSTIDKTTAEFFDPGCQMYLCKHCGKGFKVARNFLIHTSCHENPSLKLKCRLCEHETSGKNGLRAHMVSKHHVDLDGTKLEKNIKCPDCSYTCVALFQLKNHRYQSHSKPYKCEVCGYCCASVAVLSRHVQAVHQKERPYMCESCGFRAKTWQVLRNHVKMHDGKKVVCSYCGQSLTVNSFPEHVKLHTSDRKPHVCHMCAYATRKKYCLKVHLRNVHKLEIERTEERNIEQD